MCVIKKEYHNTNQPLLGIQKQSKVAKRDQYKIRLAEDNILIPEKCLKKGKEIGTGFFGCVYEGELKLPTQSNLKVAVKTLKSISKLEK